MHLLSTALFIAMLWAITGIVQKILVSNVSPESVMIAVGGVYALAVLWYGVVHYKSAVQELGRLSVKQWIGIGFIALVGYFFGTLLWYKLLREHEAYKVNTLTFLSPLFTLVLAALFLQERITVHAMIGVVFVVIGVILVSK